MAPSADPLECDSGCWVENTLQRGKDRRRETSEAAMAGSGGGGTAVVCPGVTFKGTNGLC